METYTRTRDSVDCACGGRHSNIPDIRNRHYATNKHTTWLFQKLSHDLLNETDFCMKKQHLKQMRDLLRTGRVL